MKNFILLSMVFLPLISLSQLITSNKLIVENDTTRTIDGDFFAYLSDENILFSYSKNENGSKIIDEYLITDTLSLKKLDNGNKVLKYKTIWLPIEFPLVQVFEVIYDKNNNLISISILSEFDKNKIIIKKH